MRKTTPRLGDYFVLPNIGLRSYLARTVKGNSEDYRPPLFFGRDREDVLSQWQNFIDSTDLKHKLPELYEFELEMKSKVGPLSIQLPFDERIESVENYYTLINAQSKPLLHDAIEATKDYFSPAKGIRIRSTSETIANMRLSTNSGNPYFTKRKNVIRKGQGRYPFIAVLGWRGQEGGIEADDVKQRVVWMYPFLLNVQELRFYQPAVAEMQKHNLIPAYVSMDAVDIAVTNLFKSKGSSDLVVCTDFTKFDQHFNRDMQDAAFNIESFLSASNLDRTLFDQKFNIPLLCTSRVMYEGPHGMGSGSGGTNFDECMSHKALQFEAALTSGAELNKYSMAYGDDGILTYPGITVSHVVDTYTAHGQEMNESKQYVSDHDCVVLRRWHSTDYVINGTLVGVYSTFRALGRLLGQERFYDPKIWDAQMVVLRTLSIVENCKFHPYFHQFIDFVMKGDKYKLGLLIPGFFENLDHLVDKAQSYYDDFLGYTKSQQISETGINDWEVVKYVKSKK